MATEGKAIDYLTEDTVIPGQLYTCISFLSPEGIKNCKVRGLKVRGVYASREEADRQAKKLQDEDPDFHVFVGEVGKWLPWDPSPDSVEDQVWREKQLNNLMKSYKENLSKTKKMEGERRKEMMEESIAQEQNNKNKTRDRLRRKLNDRPAPAPTQKATPQSVNQALPGAGVPQDFKKDDEVASSERLRLESNERKLEEKTDNLKKIDANLNKLQDMYKEMLKKKQDKSASN
jgi:hypothetical protein